ncbi:MAG: hypothetical protein NT069_12245 [Planctomycetota bacterium]|nr:hypothetical protein [Planctomycetota bacterium]
MSNKKKALERQRRRLEERKIRRGELPEKTAPRIAGLSAVDRFGNAIDPFGNVAVPGSERKIAELLSKIRCQHAQSRPNAACVEALRLVGLSPNVPDWRLVLAEAWKNAGFIHAALVQCRTVFERWPDDPLVNRFRSFADFAETVARSVQRSLGMDDEEICFELAWYNEAILHLACNDGERATTAGLKLVEALPEFARGWTTLATAQMIRGNYGESIDSLDRALALNPSDNIALAMKVEAALKLGEVETATATYSQLQGSPATVLSDRLAQVRAAAWMGDSAWVAQQSHTWQTWGEIPASQKSRLLRLRYAALLRLDRVAEADRLFENDLRGVIDFGDSRVFCFDERDSSRSTRQSFFELSDFLDGEMKVHYMPNVEAGMGYEWQDKALDLIRDHRRMRPMVPVLFELGHSLCQEMALAICRRFGNEVMWNAARRFASGSTGSRRIRFAAARELCQRGFLTRGSTIRMHTWGEYRDVPIPKMQVYVEGTLPAGRSAKAQRLSQEAYEALSVDNPERAERLLRQALGLYPNDPSNMQNLASALMMLDRKAEADALRKSIREQFPDYFFGQADGAHAAVVARDFATAAVFLKHYSAIPRLHITEFRRLMQIQIEYSLARMDFGAAFASFDSWCLVEEDSTQALFVERLEKSDLALRLQEILRLVD